MKSPVSRWAGGALAIAATLTSSVVLAAVTFTTVTTPKGSSVYVAQGIPELSAADIASADAKMASAYPCATRIRSASARYNCHSYAWYSQSTTNVFWMDYVPTYPNEEQKYWTDGSYIKTSPTLTSTSSFGGYGRVSYGSAGHSAYVGSSSTSLTSKWGQYGLYTHAPTCVPYGTGSISYYTRYDKCPFGNGNYCGDSVRGQTSGYLYSCYAGAYTLSSTCGGRGCKVNSPGVNDACK